MSTFKAPTPSILSPDTPPGGTKEDTTNQYHRGNVPWNHDESRIVQASCQLGSGYEKLTTNLEIPPTLLAPPCDSA